jgi:DeoR family transcriptional regulator of aga operon
VIGAAGLSVRWGVTELTDDEAEVQRAAIARADRVVVIADGSKIGTAGSAVVAPAERVESLVTDPSAPRAEVDALRAHGVAVILAGTDRSEQRRPGLPRGDRRGPA